MMKRLSIWTLLGLLICPLAVHAQISRLPRPDSVATSFFGTSVAIDGDWAVVGATGDDHCGTNAGAAWVYHYRDDAWSLLERLQPSECEEGAFFGHDVAIDGNRIVVSAFRTFIGRAVSNHVYVFEREEDRWRQSARIASPDRDAAGPFGSAIALDGNLLLVTSAGDASGDGTNGKGFVFRAPASGAGGQSGWNLEAELTSPLPPGAGTLGTSASLDGHRIAIAGSTYSQDRPGFVATWDLDDTGTWRAGPVLRGIKGFFIDVDLFGDRLLIGESRAGPNASGSARLVRWNRATWELETTLQPRSPYRAGAFGTRVSLGDGVALVAGYDEQLELDFNVDQVVYVFAETEDGWTQRKVLDVGESAFGASISLDGSRALIGQAAEGLPGQAYVATVKSP